MIIAVDFDGTCVTHEYPKMGKNIGAEIVLKKLVENGHKIILFTMRCKDQLEEAKNWFKENDIELFGVNENPTQYSWTSSPKPYAHTYIDDAALGCPLLGPLLTGESRPFVNWYTVANVLHVCTGQKAFKKGDLIKVLDELVIKYPDYYANNTI